MESKVYLETWSLYDNTFSFEVLQVTGSDGARSIEVIVKRSDQGKAVVFQGLVTASPVHFASNFPDKTNIRGTLSLIRLSPTETGLFLDVFYGPYLFKRFEGVILILNTDEEVIVVEEEEIIVEEKPIPDPILPKPLPKSQGIVIENEEYSDLFHFSGLRLPGVLPKIDRERFIPLKNSSAFYKSLQKAASGTDAAKTLNSLAEARTKSDGFQQRIAKITSQIFDLIALYDRLLHQSEPIQANDCRLIVIEEFHLVQIQDEDNWSQSLSDYRSELLNDYLSLLILLITNNTPNKNEEYTTHLEEYTLVLRLINYLASICLYGTVFSKEALYAILSVPDEIVSPLLPAPVSNPPIHPLGIGALMSVQQKVLRYESGDIAYIENVMPGERIERSQRETRSEDNFTDHSEDQSNQENRSTQNSADYLLLNSLFTPNGDPKLDFAYDTKGQKKAFDATSETLTGGWSLTLTPEQNIQTESYRYAQKILGQALSKLWKNSRNQRKSLIRHQVETLSSRIIDNQTGKTLLRGIYRWVNQVLQTRLLDQGQHLIIEFHIEEPGKSLVPPKETLAPVLPSELVFEELDFRDLTWAEYLDYAAALEIDKLIPQPLESQQVQALLQWEPAVNNLRIELPDQYLATQAALSYMHDGQSFDGFIGTLQVSKDGKDCSGQPPREKIQQDASAVNIPTAPPLTPGTAQSGCKTFQLSNLSGSLPILVFTDALHYYANIEILCERSPALFQSWQLQAYQQIKSAMEQKQLSRKEKESSETQHQEQRKLMVRTLRQRCIALLDKDLLASADPDEISHYGQVWQSSFRWEEMTFELIPDQPKASELPAMQDEAFHLSYNSAKQSPDLQKFLRAKEALVQVAVRNQRELGALFTIWTRGALWPGLKNDAPVLDSLRFYANELVFERHSHAKTDRKWEVRTPTDLLILQKDDEL